VPFDEGTLTGTLTKETKWPEGDWRNIYFVPDNLIPSVERADALKALLRRWNQEHAGEPEITLPELALRFILSSPTVSTIIPGMRKLSHVEANINASDAGPLPADLYDQLKQHRWVRKSSAESVR
jgi:aryl-alcohol dehydrogenase-like predicted oxidoreductase